MHVISYTPIIVLFYLDITVGWTNGVCLFEVKCSYTACGSLNLPMRWMWYMRSPPLMYSITKYRRSYTETNKQRGNSPENSRAYRCNKTGAWCMTAKENIIQILYVHTYTETRCYVHTSAVYNNTFYSSLKRSSKCTPVLLNQAALNIWFRFNKDSKSHCLRTQLTSESRLYVHGYFQLSMYIIWHRMNQKTEWIYTDVTGERNRAVFFRERGDYFLSFHVPEIRTVGQMEVEG